MKKKQLLLYTLTLTLSFTTVKAQSPHSISSDPVVERIPFCEYPVFETYSSEDFTAGFPSEIDYRQKDGLDITKCNGKDYWLATVICPFALEGYGIMGGAQDVGIFPDLDSRKDVVIGGLPLQRYNVKGQTQNSDTDSYYGVMYVLNSGEKTYMLIQTSDEESDWWPSHISWNIDGKPTKTPTQILNEFNDFIRQMFKDNPEDAVRMVEEGNTIKFIKQTNMGPYKRDREEAAQIIYNSIKSFTVFKHFADRQYDFTVTTLDMDGNLQSEFTFPWRQYSKWNDYTRDLDQEDEDEKGSNSTKELPEKAIGG